MRKLFGLLFVLFFCSMALGASESDRQLGTFYNFLTNGGFENGKAVWVASANTFTVDTTNFTGGKASGLMTMSAQTGTLTNTVTTTSSGPQTNASNMEAGCFVKTTLSNIQVCGLANATEVSCTTVPSTGNWQYVPTNFTGPSNGTSVGIRVKAASSSTGTVNIDECYLGKARNISFINQAQLFGSVVVTACASNWTTTSTSFADPSTQASCSYATTGNASAPATNLPAIKFSTLPAGEYMLVYDGSAGQVTSSKSAYFQFTDGTNTAREIATATNNSSAILVPGFVQSINYTTPQSNVTLKIQMKTDSAGTAQIYGSTTFPGTIKVYYFPTTPQTVVNPSQFPANWSGYHDNTCSWARTNVAYGDPAADASCALQQVVNQNFGTVATYASAGSALPGITFTPNTAPSTYYVCARASTTMATSGANGGIKMWDGTTTIAETDQQGPATGITLSNMVCGLYTASSTAAVTISLQVKSSSGAITLTPNAGRSAVEWSIVDVTRGMNAPLLVNTVPAITRLTSTGTQTGWLFNISTSSTVAVGDTYTNNSNTYTVQGALTAQSGNVLFMSGTGATSGTTLTKATGSGTASITFSTKIATATYTTPTNPTPLYLKVKIVGAGGGGSGSGTASCGAGNNGTDSFFGANILDAGPGLGATQSSCVGTGGTGGSATISTATTIISVGGGSGSNREYGGSLNGQSGTNGAASFFGGAGVGTSGAVAGGNAVANSGSGGGGAGVGSATAGPGSAGGGAGAYIEAIITSPAVSYPNGFPYIVGAKGTGGTAGTSGAAGGDGADGVITVEAMYQ